jgi:hypothetical protein
MARTPDMALPAFFPEAYDDPAEYENHKLHNPIAMNDEAL